MEEILPNVAVPLPKKKRDMILWGCVFIMVYMTMLMAGFNVLQGPILENMGAMDLFTLLSILATLGMALLNPIGGKLGDLIGRRNTVLYSGIIVAVSTGIIAFVNSPILFLILRFIISAGIGMITSAPSIILREINEGPDVPKALGYLSSGMAVGTLTGAWIAATLSDLGLHALAILFPTVPLAIGTLLIVMNFPSAKKSSTVTIDKLGILLLTIILTSLLFSMNYGGKIGWANPAVLLGFAIAIIGLIFFIKVEKKSAEPLIPLHLLKIKRYVVYLVVGFFSYFYTTAMSVYVPLAAQQLPGVTLSASGTLLIPRTIMTLIFPAIVGVWVGKKKSHSWIAMAVNALLVGACYLILGFTTLTTSLLVFYVALAITGIGESFRSVSITPAAQETLPESDIGIGTALVTFINVLSQLFSAATTGVLFDMGKKTSILAGANAVFIFTGIVSLIGLVVIIFVVRPLQQKE